MKDNRPLVICIEVNVKVNIWTGTDVSENIKSKPDATDEIGLRRVMPVTAGLDSAQLTSFHLPSMAEACAIALASRLHK